MQLETTVVTPTPQPHTQTHTDKGNSLLKSLQQHRAQRFPLPFPRPPKCFSVFHGPPHKHTHRQTVLTSTQRICKSAFIGPLAAQTHAQRKTQIYTHIHTLGVAASRNLGGGTDWQGRSEEVAEFRLWIITSVSPIVPGLRAVNTRSWNTHTHTQFYITSQYPVSLKPKKKKSQIQLLDFS